MPWVTNQTAALNRAIAVIASLFSALGIHFSFSATQGVLTITGLTIAGIAGFVWHWLVSFVSQQLIFQTAVNKTPVIPPELATALSEWVKVQAGLPSSKDLDQAVAEKSIAKGAS